MNEDILKVIVFAASMALLFGLVFRLKLSAFLALLLCGAFVGLCSGLSGGETVSALTGGFGNTLQSIGIVVALGITFGHLLHRAGCTGKIASLMLRKAGEKHIPLALCLAGYLISIPVFFDAAIVILAPLVLELSRKSGQSALRLMTALCMGMLSSLGLVVPAPGPVAVAGAFGLVPLPHLALALPLSLTGAILSGLVYGKLVSKNALPASEEALPEAGEATGGPEPSEGLSFLLITLPVLLILLCGALGSLLPGTPGEVFNFLGDKNIALLICVLIALFTLRKPLGSGASEALSEAAAIAGPILLIMGAGGSYGGAVSASGTGVSLVGLFLNANLPPLLLGFFIAMLFRIAQGSTTLSLVTTSAILAPMLPAMGVSPLLMGLAVCAGGMGLAMPNDAGFWVVLRSGKLSMRESFHCLSFAGLVSGVTALLLTLLISAAT